VKSLAVTLAASALSSPPANVSAVSLPDGPGEHVAIVTGVSRGLSAALAAELLERGFMVAGIGRAGNPAVMGQRYEFVRFDLADAAGIDAALGPVLEGLKERRPASVCLLHNAATVGSVGVLGRLAASEITYALTVNPGRGRGAGQPVLPHLRRFADEPPGHQRLFGRGADPSPGEAVYCAAKAGIEMLTRVLAAEQQAPGFRGCGAPRHHGHRHAGPRTFPAVGRLARRRASRRISAPGAAGCPSGDGVEDRQPARRR
jgi:NADP-dependent 3-hydroxy acid dehydrogenase YdfG